MCTPRAVLTNGARALRNGDSLEGFTDMDEMEAHSKIGHQVIGEMHLPMSIRIEPGPDHALRFVLDDN